MKISKILGVAAISFAAIAVLSVVFKVLGPTKELEELYDFIGKDAPSFFGYETIFGGEIEGDKVFNFGILPFLFYVVGIGGLVTAILSFLGKGPKELKYVTAGCLVVFAIGLFIMPNIVTLAGDLDRDSFKEMIELGWGAWVGGIAAILGAGSAVAGALVKD